jgi:hypothetical protein
VPRTKAEYNRRNAALLREPELAAEIRTLRQERDEARGKLKAAKKARPDERLKAIAQILLVRLSNSTGLLYRFRRVLLEDGSTLDPEVLRANIEAQEAAVAWGLENE